jgi:methylglyoxal reductase
LNFLLIFILGREDMEYRNIGLSGIKASVVGLGSWAIGGWSWGGTNELEAI